MSWRPAACPTSRPWSPLGPLPLCPWWVAPRTPGPLPTRSGRSFGPVCWGSRVGKPPQWPRSCNRRAIATWILQSPPTSRPGTESTPAWCPQTSLTGPSWTQAWAKIAKDFAWSRPRLYYYKGRNMDKLWWTMINHMITYDELDHLAKFSTAIRSKIHVAWCKKYAKRESPLQPLFPEMEAEGHEPTMRQVAQTWLGPKSYCGWKKSCTTWDGRKPTNNGINHLLTGAGFLPSTVSHLSAPFTTSSLGIAGCFFEKYHLPYRGSALPWKNYKH